VHQIPGDWQFTLLDELAKRGSGHTPNKKKPEYWNGGIKWVSLADSDKLDQIYIYETDKEISEAGLANSSAVLHPPGIVIVSRDAGVGKSAITASEMAVSQHFIIWDCGPELDNLFLYYWLQFYKPEFERVAFGSTIKTIGLPYFKKLEIVNPPLPEQRAIAAILSTWDEAITLTEWLIAALQERKRGLMQRLLTGAVRFPAFEGEEWSDIRLKELLKIEYGKSPKEVRDETGNYPVYGTGGIVEQANAYICDQPAVIIGRKGTIDQPYLALDPFWAIDTTFYCTSTGRIDVRWIYYMLGYMQLERFNEGSTLPSLSRSTLQGIPIRIPSIEEQERIAEVLLNSDEGISIFEEIAARLKTQKKGLMQRLLTGEIRVTVDIDL